MARRSITFRLTLLFAVLSTTALLALGLLVGRLVEQHFEELDVEMLNGKLALIDNVLAHAPAGDGQEFVSRQLDSALVGHHGLAVLVAGANGRRYFESEAGIFPDALLQAARPADRHDVSVWGGDHESRYRGFATQVQSVATGETWVVALATDLVHHDHFMRSFRTALWSSVVLAVLATGFLGWLAVRSGLAPLQAMRQGAAAVTAHRLDFRLPENAVPVELASLAGSLNDMLARLEESFHRLSDFSSDIAHELRTPVSNLLTQTQVTLSRARSAEEYREVLASNAEEFERMARMISDMLAKAENGLVVPDRGAVDVAAETRELFEFYEALAEEAGVDLRLEGGGSVGGDRLMLRRALSNLLSNAIRHTLPGGTVLVRIDARGEGVVRIAVMNTGAPIPEAHLPRLFDRFYRADPSRQRTGEEAGLGLAITRSIVVAHGGDIRVSQREGMVCFELSLPG